MQAMDAANKIMGTLLKGVPGFFSPRPGSLWNMGAKLPTHEVGFYDTSELQTTLERLVDFDYLNSARVRYSACAVHIATGEMTVFDNTVAPLDARHVMASGALPPGFPPVVIDGEAYWDGGIYSNTPMDIVLDDAERRDSLCFMIDLWDPTESTPSTINDAMARLKDIQYASRSHEQVETHATLQNMRRAIRLLADRLSPEDRADPQIGKILELGCGHTINIVRIIMKAMAEDGHSKDIDFSRETLTARWASGKRDVERVFKHKSWLHPPANHIGLTVHELVQE
jgi:NTE family protein